MNSAYDHLMAIAEDIPVIDTHEHLPVYANYIGEKPDVLFEYLSHYLSADLHAAGLSFEDHGKISDVHGDLMERWDILEPYLDQVRNSSYYRALQIAARKIHGLDDINRDTIQALQASFAEKLERPDFVRQGIMRDMCHIEKSITCDGSEPLGPTDLFVRTFYPESYAGPSIKVRHTELKEYMAAYKAEYERHKAAGIVCLKITSAYSRSLFFAEDVPFEEAEAIFKDYDNVTRFELPLQDYLMHYALALANEDGMAVQIHTGIQEGMFNNVENSRPMLLQNLFRKYPDITFDLFHIGYPYWQECLILAKYHPNVFVDMCWANIVSPQGSREFFREALDLLPYTKVFAFGGDYKFFDGVLGHLTMAKENICAVLAEKVDRGEYTMALAEKILRAMFYDNAKRVFGL